jgi:hypothetical protein
VMAFEGNFLKRLNQSSYLACSADFPTTM